MTAPASSPERRFIGPGGSIWLPPGEASRKAHSTSPNSCLRGRARTALQNFRCGRGGGRERVAQSSAARGLRPVPRRRAAAPPRRRGSVPTGLRANLRPTFAAGPVRPAQRYREAGEEVDAHLR